VEALDSGPGQENYKTEEQLKDHAKKWARFFRVLHHDEVTVFFARIALVRVILYYFIISFPWQQFDKVKS